eukprot:TRINITY_DN20075_c0_g1_i3.p1 TRINITY_DN20075_c0_g1~~TRINITY_DN20075_c0_g1_i3.p1  ORF type:complete len:109 (+),score=25.65 TRINITY_DN20075_c0_g1_i3:138-464(+)
MIRRPPRSTLSSSSAASDVYKRQQIDLVVLRENLQAGQAVAAYSLSYLEPDNRWVEIPTTHGLTIGNRVAELLSFKVEARGLRVACVRGARSWAVIKQLSGGTLVKEM